MPQYQADIYINDDYVKTVYVDADDENQAQDLLEDRYGITFEIEEA